MLVSENALIVKIESVIARMCDAALTSLGFNTSVLSDPADALTAARSYPIHLLVVNHSETDRVAAVDLVKALRIEQPGAAILALTSPSRRCEAAAHKAGAHLVLRKPFGPTEFMHCVEKLRSAIRYESEYEQKLHAEAQAIVAAKDARRWWTFLRERVYGHYYPGGLPLPWKLYSGMPVSVRRWLLPIYLDGMERS